uniref:(northern house mosquito) hypothetical protein n=1 Tax=Culex pipiens TaxID=7175 RepID=A0A8D8CMH4_CULPI
MIMSPGSSGSRPRSRRCPSGTSPTTSGPSCRASRKSRRSAASCTPSRWAGSKPAPRRNGSPPPPRAPSSTWCGTATTARRTSGASTTTWWPRSDPCRGTPNRTTLRRSICSTSASWPSGTATRRNRGAASCTTFRKSSTRCGRCRTTRSTCASASCVVWIFICVRVGSERASPSGRSI